MKLDLQPEPASGKDLGDLLGELRPRLEGVLRHFAIPAADAEDLLQEVCLQFLRKEPGVANSPAWLVGALRKGCLLYWRRRRRSLYRAIDQGILELARDPDLDRAERSVFRRELEALVSRLRQQCRSLISLRYGLESDRRVIAEKVGCAESSLDKLTRRCLDALGRSLLEPVRRGRHG